MTSKAEQIAAAAATALTTPTMSAVPAARVYRDLADAIAEALWPAIVIETGDEQEPVRVTIGHKMRRVDVLMTVLAEGAYSNADAALVEAHNRLAAVPTLGGLAFEFDELETTRAREGAAQNVVAVVKGYRYSFRTTEASLES